jgi:hypothetical protein
MTPPQRNPVTDPTPDPFRWNRADAAQALHDFDHPDDPCRSQRAFAQQAGVPRSTLRHWLRRRQHLGLDPQLADFLESPAGHRFLRRLVLAAHLAFHLAGPAGLRALGRFLHLAQLDHLVGASFGTQQALAVRLQQELVSYADHERQRLAATMPRKTLSVCPDENFHGRQACLVAVEPQSNFLLLEAYHPRRDGDTWTAALKQALADLPVEVVQVTSDQAKGLLALARDGLEAQHSPDLFHGQRDLSRAVAGALHRQTEGAQKEQERARGHAAAVRQEQEQYERGPRPPGRPPDFVTRLALADSCVRHAAQALQRCQQRQERAREAVRGLADDYHPFDAATGRPVTAAAVGKRLRQRVQAVADVAAEAGLGESSREALAKVRRWLVPVVASLTWYGEMVRELLRGLGLTARQRRAVREQLLAGLYWQRQASRGRDAQQKRQRRELAARLLTAAWAARGPLGRMSAERRAALTGVAEEAVTLFVRSSSCVEGRNGQLALYHHGQGPLSELRLRSLTAVHNFVVERADGTTAAERFFGSKPRPVFEWLLERMPQLPRPARRAPATLEATTAA